MALSEEEINEAAFDLCYRLQNEGMACVVVLASSDMDRVAYLSDYIRIAPAMLETALNAARKRLQQASH